jgi:hypothetical protein
MSPIACIFFQVSHNFMKHCSCSVILSLIFSFPLSFLSFFSFFVGARFVFMIFFPHQAIFIPPPPRGGGIFSNIWTPETCLTLSQEMYPCSTYVIINELDYFIEKFAKLSDFLVKSHNRIRIRTGSGSDPA